MSVLFQNISIAVIVLLAIAFLVRKYVWSPNKKSAKSCGNDDCGC